MEVHLHTVAWNDADLLGFFFDHYTPWVNHFVIHDDGSDDGTVERLTARRDVTFVPLRRAHVDSWVLSAQHVYNTSWHASRGQADWVVVANFDEHLHHADMRAYLEAQRASGVSVVPALGYQMLSEDWPTGAASCGVTARWGRLGKI